VKNDEEELRRIASGRVLPSNAQEFAESLERRRQAQDGLEDDLLNDVPLLYGMPGEVGFHDPRDGVGDPGIVLARIHREDMLRRNGVDAFAASGTRSEVRLPFERSMMWLMLLLLAISLLGEVR
jgi:hypothetical protein